MQTGDTTFCRRYPAQLVNNQMPDGIKLQALYPVVDAEKDWCGEYEARADVEPENLSQ